MKYSRMRIILVAVGVILVTGTIGTSRAEDDNDNHTASLFTPVLRGLKFNCAAVNASNKALGIVINLIEETGNTLAVVSQSLPPGQSFNTGGVRFAQATNAYCRVDVRGRNSNAVRVDMSSVYLDPNSVSGIDATRDLVGVVEGH